MWRSAFDAHTDWNLKILNFESIYKLQRGKFIYQYRSGLLPYSFNNKFLVTRQVHSYGTKSSELFQLPQWRAKIRKSSISFQGPTFFNSHSFEIRSKCNKYRFLLLLLPLRFIFIFFLSFRYFLAQLLLVLRISSI